MPYLACEMTRALNWLRRYWFDTLVYVAVAVSTCVIGWALWRIHT